jgi:hypothetical protein
MRDEDHFFPSMEQVKLWQIKLLYVFHYFFLLFLLVRIKWDLGVTSEIAVSNVISHSHKWDVGVTSKKYSKLVDSWRFEVRKWRRKKKVLYNWNFTIPREFTLCVGIFLNIYFWVPRIKHVGFKWFWRLTLISIRIIDQSAVASLETATWCLEDATSTPTSASVKRNNNTSH